MWMRFHAHDACPQGHSIGVMVYSIYGACRPSTSRPVSRMHVHTNANLVFVYMSAKHVHKIAKSTCACQPDMYIYVNTQAICSVTSGLHAFTCAAYYGTASMCTCMSVSTCKCCRLLPNCANVSTIASTDMYMNVSYMHVSSFQCEWFSSTCMSM